MFGLSKYGNGIGLHRIYRYCDARAIDLTYLSDVSIVVTGSKGKGSTTRFLYEALRDSLRDVGCFTSPHLLDVTERYEFAGKRIESTVFDRCKAAALGFAHQLAAEGDSLGEF